MDDFNCYNQKIEALIQALKKSILAEDAIQTNEILASRLVLLKELDDKIKRAEISIPQSRYEDFLKYIQREDQKQLDALLLEKIKISQESQKQVKNKAAIGQYKNISQNK